MAYLASSEATTLGVDVRADHLPMDPLALTGRGCRDHMGREDMPTTWHHGSARPASVGLVAVVAVALFAVVEVLFGSGPAVGSTPATHGDVDAGHTMVRLTADGPTVQERVDTVRRHAHRTPGADGDVDMTVVLSGNLARELSDERPLLAGLQRGSTAFVRVDLAWPERTVLHEVAHVATEGDGHGHIWRAVYLGAMAELYGPDAAHREARRIAWVYDRCYLTDSCPRRPDDGTAP